MANCHNGSACQPGSKIALPYFNSDINKNIQVIVFN
jgi:hypothetical protein